MITTADQYNANLHLIHNMNPPIYATLPTADNIYNIDLNTREIDAPKFLGVEKDHDSETIYFIIDRYADYMDLATTCCIITYTNALNESKIYRVPFYDIYTFALVDKMVFPWVIDADLTVVPGTIEFSIQFFKVGTELDLNSNEEKLVFKYNLNTRVAKSTVLKGMVVKQMSEGYEINPSQYMDLVDAITAIENQTKAVYWTIFN